MGVGAAGYQQYQDPNSSSQPGTDQTIVNNPDQQNVQGSGPGGATVVINQDSLIPPGPSQQGMPGTSRGASATVSGDVNASVPNLVAGTSTTSVFGNLFTSLTTGSSSDDSDDMLSLFSQSGAATATGGTLNMNSLVGPLLAGSGGGTASSASTVLQALSTTQLNAVLPSVTDDSGTTSQTGSTTSQTSTTTTTKGQSTDGLSSTDESTVYQTLVAYADLDNINPPLTPDQKAMITGKLQILAQDISDDNSNGTATGLSGSSETDVESALANMLGSDPSLSASDQTALSSALSTIAYSAVSASSPNALGEMGSTDSAQVLQALLQYTGAGSNMDSGSQLTADQQKLVTTQLTALAQAIATQNASGGPNPLTSSDPNTLLTTFENMLNLNNNTTMSSDDQTLLIGYLTTAANGLGATNSANGVTPPTSPLYTEMNSTSSSDVLTALTTMATNGGMTSDQLQQIMPQPQTIAGQIAQSNSSGGTAGLDSPDSTTVSDELTALIGADNDPTLSDGTKSILSAFVKTVSTSIASTNKDFYTQETYSSDPKIIFQGLMNLSNVNNNKNLSPTEKTAIASYLTLMAQAIGFMSQVRATIVSLEADLRQDEAHGKLSEIQSESTLALQAFTKNMNQISSNLDSQLAAIVRQLLLEIFLPIIAAIIAIIAVILIIVTLGAATPVAIGLIAATVAMTAASIAADATISAISQAAEASGTTFNNTAAEAANCAIQAFVMALMVLFTLGIAAPAMAADLTETAAETVFETVKNVVNAVMKEMAENGMKDIGDAIGKTTKNEAVTMGGMAMSTLFTSGLGPDLLTQLFEKMGMNKADAAIVAMVASLLLMITMLTALEGALDAVMGDVGAAAKGATAVGKGAAGASGGSTDMIDLTESSVSDITSTLASAKDAASVEKELNALDKAVNEIQTDLNQAEAVLNPIMQELPNVVQESQSVGVDVSAAASTSTTTSASSSSTATSSV
ncbi:MAG: hypothetical protein JSR46_02925, partial [Verrucomicrobia bacterium]|nr:hypothetical protein [Verrucomicrobiota bacterium]